MKIFVVVVGAVETVEKPRFVDDHSISSVDGKWTNVGHLGKSTDWPGCVHWLGHSALRMASVVNIVRSSFRVLGFDYPQDMHWWGKPNPDWGTVVHCCCPHGYPQELSTECGQHVTNVKSCGECG